MRCGRARLATVAREGLPDPHQPITSRRNEHARAKTPSLIALIRGLAPADRYEKPRRRFRLRRGFFLRALRFKQIDLQRRNSEQNPVATAAIRLPQKAV